MLHSLCGALTVEALNPESHNPSSRMIPAHSPAGVQINDLDFWADKRLNKLIWIKEKKEVTPSPLFTFALQEKPLFLMKLIRQTNWAVNTLVFMESTPSNSNKNNSFANVSFKKAQRRPFFDPHSESGFPSQDVWELRAINWKLFVNRSTVGLSGLSIKKGGGFYFHLMVKRLMFIRLRWDFY